jgi:PH (Pleckstrin Homology) domain-containing protein
MGFLNAILGNASEINVSSIAQEFQPILADNEQVEKAFKLVRDLFVFTNKRLILVDKQGITGKKIEYHSIPYRSITHFSIETAGHFDLDSELKIYLAGSDTPFEKKIKRGDNVLNVQKTLANYILW